MPDKTLAISLNASQHNADAYIKNKKTKQNRRNNNKVTKASKVLCCKTNVKQKETDFNSKFGYKTFIARL